MKNVTLSRSEFIRGMEELISGDTDANIDGASRTDDIKEFALSFFANHKGEYIKRFLKEVCRYDEDEINKGKRNEHIEILSKYVTFTDSPAASHDEMNDILFDENLYTLATAQTLFEQCKAHKRIKENSSVRIVDHFEIYHGAPVTYSDRFKIKKNPKVALAPSLCMIIDKNDVVIAVGVLAENESEYRIVINNDEDSISYDKFKNVAKFNVIVFEKNYNPMLKKWCEDKAQDIEAITVPVKIKISDLKETDKPLCIDFGTSNTTAGTYGLKAESIDAASCVEFEYGRGNNICTSKLLPTMVYVKSCENRDDIAFLFGYKAKEKVIKCKYDTDATVYFELKRWITELNVPEEIVEDENGNTCENVSRAKIIEAYLRYVITLSEWYYKVRFHELHFSAPVKLKSVFIREIKKMLPEYKVYSSEKSLDEGSAIVFDYIANEIDRTIEKATDKSKDATDRKKVLILDCGGGTTDLVNCEYGYRTGISEGDALLEVNSQFENGNPNFGGNNITFRILQLIKIKMVDAFYPDVVESSIDKLIPFSEPEILDKIDIKFNNGERPLISGIYSEFEEMYLKCEKYIPTKYAESEYNKSESKRNYFYLWQLAEKIKVEFYKQTNLATYNLEHRISVEKIDDFYLYRLDETEDEIVKAGEIPRIEVTNNEIKKVIYADIYAVMNDLFANIDINSFDKYKLSGQSCKVTLFQELLKEFITGRKLRETNMKTSNGTENLKLGCINGCIAFNRGIKRGEIVSGRSADTTKEAKLIYTVNLVTKGTTTLLSPDKVFGGSFFGQSANELKIEVKNAQGEPAREPFVFKTSQEMYKNSNPVDMTDIRNIITNSSSLSDSQVDALCKELEGPKFDALDNGMIIFAAVSKDGYGFNMYPLYVEKEEGTGYHYYFPQPEENGEAQYTPEYQNFESVSTTFFDGHR